jgi:hypothetical protein
MTIHVTGPLYLAYQADGTIAGCGDTPEDALRDASAHLSDLVPQVAVRALSEGIVELLAAKGRPAITMIADQ